MEVDGMMTVVQEETAIVTMDDATLGAIIKTKQELRDKQLNISR